MMNLNSLSIMSAFLLVAVGKADAQTVDPQDTALVLAQSCVAEVDFDRLEECRVMWHINADLANKRAARDPSWHLIDQLKAYNSAFKVESPRTRWVRELNLEGDKPPSWPATAPGWDRVAPRWLEIIEAARAFLLDPGRHPCPSANAYGGSCFNNPHGACDDTPNCWVQVVCHKRRQKPFAQAYYAAKRCN